MRVLFVFVIAFALLVVSLVVKRVCLGAIAAGWVNSPFVHSLADPCGRLPFFTWNKYRKSNSPKEFFL